MKHLKLFESMEPNTESIISEVKKIIDANSYIKDKDVTEEKLIIGNKWIIYIQDSTLEHIKSHMEPSIELGDAPGSYYTEDWKKGVEKALNFEPELSPNPPFRCAWTGVNAGIDVGYVTIGHDNELKKDVLPDGYKTYSYKRPIGGDIVDETIVIKQEEAEKTKFITVVGSKIGEVDGKGLISLWTTYPDFEGGKIKNMEIPRSRNDFKKNGFYFKCTKEFFDKIPMNESKKFQHLKSFKSL